ncbi:MAG: DoxX family protein [Elusimicrobia bacterium]|nr:DoxX family protein [Elusimicrobiota bacterium]
MNALLLLGRALFSAIFVTSGPKHFGGQMISYAANQGVPLPGVLVPLSGLLALLGGLMVLVGWRARAGAWLLILFLVPVSFMMHGYWNLADPMEAMQQQIHFWKNMAMLGGALAFAYFGAGPYSLDYRRTAERAARVPLPERRREPVAQH